MKSLQKERERTVFCGQLDKKEWVYVAGEDSLMGFQGSEVLGQSLGTHRASSAAKF